MAEQRIPGFRLGIYIFKDAEIVDFAAPYGVFSVARRFDPELEAFLIADANRPVQAQAGFTVLPNYLFNGPTQHERLFDPWWLRNQTGDPQTSGCMNSSARYPTVACSPASARARGCMEYGPPGWPAGHQPEGA